MYSRTTGSPSGVMKVAVTFCRATVDGSKAKVLVIAGSVTYLDEDGDRTTDHVTEEDDVAFDLTKSGNQWVIEASSFEDILDQEVSDSADDSATSGPVAPPPDYTANPTVCYNCNGYGTVACSVCGGACGYWLLYERGNHLPGLRRLWHLHLLELRRMGDGRGRGRALYLRCMLGAGLSLLRYVRRNRLYSGIRLEHLYRLRGERLADLPGLFRCRLAPAFCPGFIHPT